MSKTMVANIPGARLREVEQQLALLRGEAAVTAYIEAHPNETKVLQQLVELRRSGRNLPPLARVQRAMLWSDGSIELSAAPAPESPGRLRGGPSGPARPGAAGPMRGGARRGGPPRGGRPGERGPGGGRPGASSQGRSDDRGPRGPRAARELRDDQPPRAQRIVLGAGAAGPEVRPADSRPPDGRRGGRPGFRRDDRGEGGARGVPHEGEGWVLLRPGEAPPPGPTLGGLAAEEAERPAEQAAQPPAERAANAAEESKDPAE